MTKEKSLSIEDKIQSYIKGINQEIVYNTPHKFHVFRTYAFKNFTIQNIRESENRLIADVSCKAFKKPALEHEDKPYRYNYTNSYWRHVRDTLKSNSSTLSNKAIRILTFKEELEEIYEADQIKKLNLMLDGLYSELIEEKERTGEIDFLQFFPNEYDNMRISDELKQNPTFRLVNFMSEIFHNPKIYEEMKQDVKERDSSPIDITLEIRI